MLGGSVSCVWWNFQLVTCIIWKRGLGTLKMSANATRGPLFNVHCMHRSINEHAFHFRLEIERQNLEQSLFYRIQTDGYYVNMKMLLFFFAVDCLPGLSFLVAQTCVSCVALLRNCGFYSIDFLSIEWWPHNVRLNLRSHILLPLLMVWWR